jgi:hypothetical protein
MRGVAQHGASVVPAGPNLTAPFNHAQMRCELNCAAALANTALEFSLTLGVKSGLFTHAYGQTVSNQFVFARCHSNPTRRCGLTTT